MSIGSRESPLKWLADNLRGEGEVAAIEKRPPPLRWLAEEIRKEREAKERSREAATPEARAGMSIERAMPEYAAQYKDRGEGTAWQLLGLGAGYGILIGAYAPLKGVEWLHHKYDPKGAAMWRKWYKAGKGAVESAVSPELEKRKKPKPQKRRASNEEAVRSVREALGVPEDEGGTTAPTAPTTGGATAPPAPTTSATPEGGEPTTV